MDVRTKSKRNSNKFLGECITSAEYQEPSSSEGVFCEIMRNFGVATLIIT